jgi:Tfp pilus assembly major pilin PilA
MTIAITIIVASVAAAVAILAFQIWHVRSGR